MRILLTGSSGQVGGELTRHLGVLGEVIATDRPQFDLADVGATRNAIRALQPDLIVNAAAYTAVDTAEQEPKLAEAVNGVGPGILAIEAKRLGAVLVHYSTDYVFDGRKNSPYKTTDETNPLSVYGRSKLAGEQAVLASGAQSLILRTSWVYGLAGSNFLRSILRKARSEPELRVVDDQIGRPTWSRVVARATVRMIESSLSGGRGAWSFSGKEGLYHVTCSGQTTWHGFAKRILDIARPESAHKLKPIASDAYPTAAVRPPYSVLSCDKTTETFDLTLPSWSDALDEVLKQEGNRDSSAEAEAISAGDRR